MWTCDVNCLPVRISLRPRVNIASLRLWNYNHSIHVILCLLFYIIHVLFTDASLSFAVFLKTFVSSNSVFTCVQSFCSSAVSIFRRDG